LFAGEKAWKKRPFFPEDVIDSNYLFHSSLLSNGSPHITRENGEK
jgi:hypothetical protein